MYTATINNERFQFVRAGRDSTFPDPTTGQGRNSTIGNLYHYLYGKVQLSDDALYDYPSKPHGKLILTGENQMSFSFELENSWLKVMLGSDSNGSFEKGLYFPFIDDSHLDFFYTDTSALHLFDSENLTYPPRVMKPSLVSDELSTLADITVQLASITDLDTPIENLTIKYKWIINDIVLINQTTDTLPAGIAVYGDKVEVVIVVIDEHYLVESDRLAIELVDTSPILQFIDVPTTAQAGSVVTFTARLVDPDLKNDVGLPAQILSSPDDVTIASDGTITWNTPDNLMFSKQQFQFVFKTGYTFNNYEKPTALQIELTRNMTTPILVRSNRAAPEENNSLIVGDFYGDNKNELLATDNDNLIYLQEFVDDEYQQTWVYPYKLPTSGKIKQIFAYNSDHDPHLEIYILTEHGLSFISDINAMAIEIPLGLGETYFHQLIIDDTDLDGEPELLLLTSKTQYDQYSKLVSVIDLSNPADILFNHSISSTRQIAVGNVDTDPQLELVTNTGLVFDGKTWENEWLYTEGFGYTDLILADFDNDGINEIAASDIWAPIKIIDVTSKSLLAEFEYNNVCSIGAFRPVNNAPSQLVVGGCYSSAINSYQLTGETMTEMWEIQSPKQGTISFTAGDSDNDGKPEVHWGSGTYGIRESAITIGDLDNNTQTQKLNNNWDELNSFATAGWSEITPGVEKAVFFVPSTSNNSGAKILMLDYDGTIEVSDHVSTLPSGSSHATTTDYNLDGNGDIFLPTNKIGYGSLSALQLTDLSLQWHLGEANDSNVNNLKRFDLNSDGTDDALITSGSNFKAFDIYNEKLITSKLMTGSISDFDVINHLGNKYIALSTYDKNLVLIQYGPTGLNVLDTIEQECLIVRFIFPTNEPTPEVLCIKSRRMNPSNLSFYTFQNNELIKKSAVDINTEIVDIVVDQSSADNQQFYTVANSRQNHSDPTEFNLYLHSTSGYHIWQSPNLVGQFQLGNLKHRRHPIRGSELLISSDDTVYWLSPRKE